MQEATLELIHRLFFAQCAATDLTARNFLHGFYNYSGGDSRGGCVFLGILSVFAKLIEYNTEWGSMEKGSGVLGEGYVFLGMLFNFATMGKVFRCTRGGCVFFKLII